MAGLRASRRRLWTGRMRQRGRGCWPARSGLHGGRVGKARPRSVHSSRLPSRLQGRGFGLRAGLRPLAGGMRSEVACVGL
jgi:hypothetical protein